MEWTEDALADLKMFTDYIETARPLVAERAAADIVLRARRLGRSPGIGRAGRRRGTRELSLSRWSKIILYRVLDDRVQILALLDPRRNI